MASKGPLAKRANGTNICIKCQKACGRCSWSERDFETGKVRFEPIPGWTAKKVLLNLGNRGDGGCIKSIAETYHITGCPEFVPDKPRVHGGSCEYSDEEFAAFLKMWRLLKA